VTKNKILFKKLDLYIVCN